MTCFGRLDQHWHSHIEKVIDRSNTVVKIAFIVLMCRFSGSKCMVIKQQYQDINIDNFQTAMNQRHKQYLLSKTRQNLIKTPIFIDISNCFFITYFTILNSYKDVLYQKRLRYHSL